MNKQKSHFNWLRRLAIAALVCTVLLLGIIFFESSLDSGASEATTNYIKNAIRLVVPEKEKTIIPQQLMIDDSQFYSINYFVGDKIKINIKSSPENADKSVKYSFSNEHCVVDENGYFICNDTSLTSEIITIYIESTLNPSIKNEADIYIRALSPDSPAVNKNIINITNLNNYSKENGNNLAVGVPYRISGLLELKEDYIDTVNNKNGTVDITSLDFDYSFSNDISESDYYFSYLDKSFTFFKPYDGTLTIKYKKGIDTYFNSDNSILNVPISVQVKENYTPTEPLIPNQCEFIDGEYVFTYSNTKFSLNIKPLPVDNKTNIAYIEFADNKGAELFKIMYDYQLQAKRNVGECYVNLVSILNPSLKTKIKVVIKPDELPTFNILGEDNLALHNGLHYTTTYNIKTIYVENNIKWELIEGNDIATIDENGLVCTNGLGKIKIRATNKEFPELYKEKEITITVWTDFYTFVRKIIGHFGMFFVLGIGFAGTYLLFLKRRTLTFILTPISIGITAFSSEVIQYFTEGRFAYVSDMIIDFIGGFAGMIFAMGIILLVMMIWSIFNNKSYKNLQRDFKNLHTKTIFKKKS